MNAQTSLYNEITVDGFCGGGGWSTGFELAIGEPVTIGINHDAAAIALHKKNHPHTKHYNENIWEVDPYEATQGRPVGWAHFSPDCKHFSRAKGDKPVNKTIRSLAWVVTKWAGTVGPRIISMENVPEFLTWGPLVAKRDKETGRCFKIVGEDEKGKPIIKVATKGERVPYFEQLLTPDTKRSGKTFKAFIRTLEQFGYVVEWCTLKACDYGAPTTRSRLFIMARRDGKPIVWPEPTHGDPKSDAVKNGKLLPWVPAAEIIDWSLPCPSIFDTAGEIYEKYGLRAQRPLAEATMRRIARGIQKFVIDNPAPFIVDFKFDNVPKSTAEPLNTITAVNGYGIVTPIITSIGQTGFSIDRSRSILDPLNTTVSKAEQCLLSPVLAPWTVTNTTNSTGHPVNEPIDTVRTGGGGGQMLVTPTLIQYHGEKHPDEVRGQALESPIMTIDGSGRYAMVSAFLSKYYDGGHKGCGNSAGEPLNTITSVDHNALVTANIVKLKGTNIGQDAGIPLHTATSKDTFGLVTIHGTQYAIVDIGLRMLTPRELYNAQGFPPDYEIETDAYGNSYSKKEQVAKCGNSVPPQFPYALARANWPEKCKNVDLASMRDFNDYVAV